MYTPIQKQTRRAFTIVELLVVVAIIGMLSSIAMTVLSDARLDARDKRRISDLQQLQKALQLYYVDNNRFPTEASGANGNVATNSTFQALIDPYLSGNLVDPAGLGNPTYYYYYDGAHNCGGQTYAVIFARQMDKADNANHAEFLDETCLGILDGEGRGGGTQSYNIRL